MGWIELGLMVVEMAKVLVLFHSITGNVMKLAKVVAEGASIEGG